MRIEFAYLDCKDFDAVWVYSPHHGETQTSAHNERIRQEAEREFLSGLFELQKEIREKYQAQLTDDKDVDEIDEVEELRWSYRIPSAYERLAYS